MHADRHLTQRNRLQNIFYSGRAGSRPRSRARAAAERDYLLVCQKCHRRTCARPLGLKTCMGDDVDASSRPPPALPVASGLSAAAVSVLGTIQQFPL